MEEPAKLPTCFGRLETVFPKGEDGLRHSPASCLACDEKTGCLRIAMESIKGLDVREEAVDRAYESGMIGFLERWLKKKSFRQKKKALEE